MALVVTIVVILIIAGISINMVLGQNGLITKAQEARIKTEYSGYKEELELFNGVKAIENSEYSIKSLNAWKTGLEYNTKTEENGNIRNIITNLSNNDIDKFQVINGELLIKTTNQKELEIANSLGIKENPYSIKDGTLESVSNNKNLVKEDGTLEIPKSVSTISSGAFSGINSLKKLVVPGSVKIIEDDAFSYNYNLESIEIEEGVTSIGDKAFQYCSNLNQVKLPNTLENMGTLCFYQCKQLKEIEIPGSVERIQAYTFSGCYSLEKIKLNEGLKRIENYALAGVQITELEFPNTLETLERLSFSGVEKLENIVIKDNKNFSYKNSFLTNVNSNSIIYIAGSYLEKVENFELPSNVEKFDIDISSYSNIKALTIPKNITNIGDAANFPPSIENVIVDSENNIFKSENEILYTISDKKLIMCYSKEKDITIQEGIKTLGTYSFKQANNAENVVLPDSLENIENIVFSYTSFNYKTIKIGKNVSSISSTFKVLNYSGEVTIDKQNPYYMIENDVLYSKDKKELVCPLKEIEGTYTIDSSVETIKAAAFDVQTKIEGVIIPEGVKTLEYGAFSQCANLKRVEIPSTVTSIANDTFERCNNLSEIIVNKKENTLSGSPWGAPKGRQAVTWKK